MRRNFILPQGVHIPVLMYHGISGADEGKTHPYYRTETSPERFAGHMRFLHEHGYSVIRLSELRRYLKPGRGGGGKHVVLTFDDGFRDFYAQAFPLLQKYGFTATVFLPTGFIGNTGRRLRGKEHLHWDEVRALHGDGIDLGSHTVTHQQLQSLNREELYYELKHSKETIEDRLGGPVESFSCPFAFPEGDMEFRRRLRSMLRKLGYRRGVSTRIGTTSREDDVFFMKRIPVNSCDDDPLLRAKLLGGYDWLNVPQRVFKSLMSRVRGISGGYNAHLQDHRSARRP